MDYGAKIKTWQDIAKGDSCSFTKTVTETDVMLWVGSSGDLNPLHIDRVYGKSTPFGDIIVPGMYVMGFISNVITQVAFGNVYANQSVKFLKPVYIGDTITATATVVEKIDAKKMIRLETKCMNQKDELVIIGDGMEYILG